MVTSTLLPALNSPLAVAPMINWTNRHFRMFMRLLAPQALLYTEMQTYGAIIHNPQRSIAFSAEELPLALQLGGAHKDELMICAKLAAEKGFSEVNLNLGCPSAKVQAGFFGACLMLQPQLVVDCIKALKDSVTLPISAKLRLGVDNFDSYEFFADFVYQLVNAGCDKLIIHARKAWLNGLSPKQNRLIPAINYDFVYKIKQEIKDLPIIINGNIVEVTALSEHLQYVDGVMIGRLAYQNPYALALMHNYLYSDMPILLRSDILLNYLSYIQLQLSQNVPLAPLLKPLFNIVFGLPHSKFWQHGLQKAMQEKNLNYFEEAIKKLKYLEADLVYTMR